MHVVLNETSLDKYPELKDFLHSDAPDLDKLPNALNFQYEVSCKIGGQDSTKKITILSLCALLGKLNHITLLLPTNCKTSDLFQPVRWALVNGHKETLNYLINRLSHAGKERMVEALSKHLDFRMLFIRYALDDADEAGFNMMPRICKYFTSEQIIEELKRTDYFIMASIAKKGDLQRFVEFEQYLTAEERLEMISAEDFRVVRCAADSNQLEMLNHCLGYPQALAYAESNSLDVELYIIMKLTEFKEAKSPFEEENPDAYFDLNETDSQIGFYILRRLIRHNNQELRDDIEFLLNIPAIRSIVHQPITANSPNELLRLAMNSGNLIATELLLNIPAVYHEAGRHDYYRNEMEAEVSENILAAFSESAMVVLSEGQKKQLKKLTDHYHLKMNKNDLENAFSSFKETLKQRYLANPARINVGGEQFIDLPFDWNDFQRLELSNEARENALQAYYKHKEHTAFRYLSIPNYWMHPEARYINRGTDGSGWADFSSFENLIGLLWIAASDNKMELVDGYTLEGRISHFIDEMAHLGRAHNHDKKQEIIIKDQVCTGEYDDMEADKPCCRLGVDRHLFQSLVGHPLMRPFNWDLIECLLGTRLKAYFFKQISPEKAIVINDALNAVEELNDFTEEQKEVLLSINLNERAKRAIRISIEQAFKDEFRANRALKDRLRKEFDLKDDAYHFLDFCARFDFKDKLDTFLPKTNASDRKKQTLCAELQVYANVKVINRYTMVGAQQSIIADHAQKLHGMLIEDKLNELNAEIIEVNSRTRLKADKFYALLKEIQAFVQSQPGFACSSSMAAASSSNSDVVYEEEIDVTLSEINNDLDFDRSYESDNEDDDEQNKMTVAEIVEMVRRNALAGNQQPNMVNNEHLNQMLQEILNQIYGQANEDLGNWGEFIPNLHAPQPMSPKTKKLLIAGGACLGVGLAGTAMYLTALFALTGTAAAVCLPLGCTIAIISGLLLAALCADYIYKNWNQTAQVEQEEEGADMAPAF